VDPPLGTNVPPAHDRGHGPGGGMRGQRMKGFESGAGFGLRGFGLAPYVRVEDYVEEGDYVLRAEMPGIDPDKDVDLQIEGDVLTIRGERREEEKDKYHHEFHYGSFTRSVPLPHGVKPEEISAKYADGVLEVRVPVGREAQEPRRIPVQRAST
jgi:HSP20 family protein